MFSEELLEQIFVNDRLRGIPLSYQSAVIHAVEDEVEKRYYTEHKYNTKEDVLKDICTRG